MKFNFKSLLLLLSASAFCLTTSCSGKSAADKVKGEVSTMLEAIELGADPQKAKEANEDVEVLSDEEAAVSTNGRGQWDGNALMYNDDPRRLFWDISTFQNWDIVDEDRLPKDTQFAAINEDYNIVVLLNAIPLTDKAITSVWQLSKEDVIKKSLAVQDKAFPGSKNQEPTVEKVQFRNKSAYQITFLSDVPDYRHDETVIVPYQIRMVAVVSDNEIIELVVMMPQDILDQFGGDAYNLLIGKFNFVDPA